jgi:hypothetical protein
MSHAASWASAQVCVGRRYAKLSAIATGYRHHQVSAPLKLIRHPFDRNCTASFLDMFNKSTDKWTWFGIIRQHGENADLVSYPT